jgi:hypothetical protein
MHLMICAVLALLVLMLAVSYTIAAVDYLRNVLLITCR